MALNMIHIENFTVFDKMKIEFSRGINIFIGENGTGKTHLLKAIYALSKCEVEPWTLVPDPSAIITEHFQVKDLVPLINSTLDSSKKTFIEIDGDSHSFFFALDDNPFLSEAKGKAAPIPFIFIPAKEMLTHSGLEKDYAKRNLPLDITLIDILNNAGVSTMKELPENMLCVLENIAHNIGGIVIYSNNHYYVQKPNGRLIDFAVEAEGFKKLGLIYRLIETGNITAESTLLWDEPESNLNPKMIPTLVDIILALEKAGVQMIFATHDYFFAKYLELRKCNNNRILFHSLYKNDSGNIRHESADDFTTLENNPIIAEQLNLYKEEVRKVLD